MRWNHLAVEAEMGVKEGIECAGCHSIVTDLLFYPRDYSSLEAEQVLKAAKADPRNSEIDPDAFAGSANMGLMNCSKRNRTDERRREVSEYQDKRLTCVDCGGTFLWSAKDQEFFRDRGYSEPKRCKACRQAKKDQQNANRMKGGEK